MQESNRIEFKRELTDTLEKEVVAFLNYRDGGVIYIGIDDKRPVCAGVPRILAHYPHTIYRFTPNFVRLVLPYSEGFDQATDQSDEATDQATDQAEELLKFCLVPRSVKEMMQYLGLSHRPNFRRMLLHPLITSGKLISTIPDKPSSPKQRYVAVENK